MVSILIFIFNSSRQNIWKSSIGKYLQMPKAKHSGDMADEDDWHRMSDQIMRKRAQNRLAQRRHRLFYPLKRIRSPRLIYLEDDS